MARKRGKSRWLALAAVVLIAFVYSANQPFYAGSSLGPNHKWRMEHGRLTLTRSSVVVQTSFWMDYNSEGMRWGWDGRRYEDGDWWITIPLWAPLGLALAWCAWAWRPRRGRVRM